VRDAGRARTGDRARADRAGGARGRLPPPLLHGTKPEALAEVAATIRSHGARNPAAVYYRNDEPVTKEEVLASAERARDLDVTPIYLLGGGLDRQGMSYVGPPVWDRYGEVGGRAARLAFTQAGLGPDDVDVAELYDPFSFEIIRQLEAMGFCKPGEGSDFVSGGRIAVGGALPVAPNGGLLSYSHAGLAQLLQKPIAAVEQLRGELPAALTVPDAKVAIASNGGAGALFCDVLLLGREPA
jgi:acetyl-CoA acetyltransferase